jgi:hypothetical protein
MTDNDFQTFTFTFTDYEGVEISITRKEYDGFFWHDIIKDVCLAIEKAFGYEIMENIKIKGKTLDRFDRSQHFAPSWVDDEEEDNFPEAKSGLTD